MLIRIDRYKATFAVADISDFLGIIRYVIVIRQCISRYWLQTENIN